MGIFFLPLSSYRMNIQSFCRLNLPRQSLFFSLTRSFCEKKPSIVPILREIRAKTGAGVMDCKRTLEKNGMDVEKTIAELMKKARSSQGRDGRVTSAGWIGFAAENSKGVLADLHTETDFVAKNDQFKSLSDKIAKSSLLIEKTDQNYTIDVDEAIQMKEGVVNGYVHGGRIGVLVGLQGGEPTEELARDIAIHIAACSPKVISPEDVSEGDDIKSGDILVQQDYIHDESITVGDVLKKHGSPTVFMNILRR